MALASIHPLLSSVQSSDVWLYPKPQVSDTTTCVWLDGKDTRVWLYYGGP